MASQTLVSNLKLITSGSVPNTSTLSQGEMAFGYINEVLKLYCNANGSVSEFAVDGATLLAENDSCDDILPVEGKFQVAVCMSTAVANTLTNPPSSNGYFVIFAASQYSGPTCLQTAFCWDGGTPTIRFREYLSSSWTSWTDFNVDVGLSVGTVTSGDTAAATITGSGNNYTLNLTLPKGADGADGTSATVSIGTVTTGEAGTSAAVTNSGTDSAAVLNFTIPRGADADNPNFSVVANTLAAGSTATVALSGTYPDLTLTFGIPRGADGTDGEDGEDGQSPTISIGTVTTGDTASATLTGTYPAYVLNLVIPSASNDEEIANLQSQIDTLTSSLASETSLRESQDSVLQGLIDDINTELSEIDSRLAATAELSVDSSTYIITLTLKASDGTTLSTATIDLPLESVVVSASYSSSSQSIILTLQNGTTTTVPVGDLVAGLATQTDLDAEVTARTSADTALGDRIDDIEDGTTTVGAASSAETAEAISAVALTSNADLNDCVPDTVGQAIVYYASTNGIATTISNIPSAVTTSFKLTAIKLYSSGTDLRCLQELRDNANHYYIRRSTSSTAWTDWAEVILDNSTQTISGSKTFSSSVNLGNFLYLNGISSGNYKDIQFRNDSNTRIGTIRCNNYASGVVNILLGVNYSDNAPEGIAVAADTDGTIIATAPTPSAGDDSTKIATTAWVNDLLDDGDVE